jgi:two-component system, cell cycle response regulator DivK
MSEMHGYEAARRVERSPGGDRLTIVAVTSHAMSGDRNKAPASGFFGCTEKPMATSVSSVKVSNSFPEKAVPHENPERR